MPTVKPRDLYGLPSIEIPYYEPKITNFSGSRCYLIYIADLEYYFLQRVKAAHAAGVVSLISSIAIQSKKIYIHETTSLYGCTPRIRTRQ